MGKQTSVLIPLMVGLLAGAYFFTMAVSQGTRPLPETGSGFALPPLLPQEALILSHTGSGTIQGEVRDEATFKKMLLTHYTKGFALTSHLRRVSEDPDVQGIADSMMRRYLRYIVQARKEAPATDGPWPSLEQPPFPFETSGLSMDALHREFLSYMIRHHYWSTSVLRQALTLPLEPKTASSAKNLLFVERAELSILEAMAAR